MVRNTLKDICCFILFYFILFSQKSDGVLYPAPSKVLEPSIFKQKTKETSFA